MGKRDIRLFYSRRRNGEINFGDDISPMLFEAITGQSVCHARVSNCDFAAVGSLLEMLVDRRLKRLRKFRFDPVRVWGSGCLTGEGQVSSFLLDPIALRGPVTRARLGDRHDVPLGDPGLLFDRLHTPKREKTYKWGIVLHYTDVDSPVLRQMLETTPGVVNIPVNAPPMETLRLIGECECIASSSLHGLIAADCYGIPNVRLRVEKHLDPTNSKFLDYAAAIGRPDIAAIQAPDHGSLDAIYKPEDADLSYFEAIPKVAEALERALQRAV
ncbi:polysaccharide pyruvyl transferase family protein [Tritonibacter horizontis]|uniref:Polysaccharide pyruvyl transferase n=1 Tax=Tritonibacter horizontis TaxID=1768241 RepID=A0A132BYN5_9RHOB|nr:polysaccharide pyruvyl transferase family protein [Tritonibacter horizontis]KUP92840.1 polysaccharide pyruvyl transferase [Tritonibacter horizontis]